MSICYYTDCMAIDDQVETNKRYPALIDQAFADIFVKSCIVALDGSTTQESVRQLEQIPKKRDVYVYAFGINDALPRGLSRTSRGKIIRSMYKLHFSKQLRLLARKYFLNPLEYAVQVIRGPKFYYTKNEMIRNINTVIDTIKTDENLVIVININPILNYRFRSANQYINEYNKVIREYCEEKHIPMVDAEKAFYDIGLRSALAADLFHYSSIAHRKVSDATIRFIKEWISEGS